MKICRESIIHNQSPEYRHALQELIKFELQALVERLSVTGEEALVLTASCQDGTSMQFGSQKAEGFLRKQIHLGQDFLTYCNDDVTQSSADEMCNSGDEIEDADQKDDEDLSKQTTPQLQFSPHRQRERTSSKRISFSEDHPKPSYEVSQNSDLSERNDSASSVASFVEAQENSINKLQCKVCSRNFRSYKTLNVHMRLHMAKSYKCAVCRKIFTMKTSYKRHIEGHKLQNIGKLFECGICDKSFTDVNAWKRHREIHLEVRNYSCNLCGKAFFEKYSLRVHQTGHFYPAVKSDKNTDMSSGYSCHICGKVSKAKAEMKKHMSTHSAKKHTCEFCNKRFSVKYSYVRHRRIHTGEKPYKCGSCERSFSDSSAWAKHIRTHTGGKEYSCDLCSKSFYDKTLCKTHMKRHQGIQSFKLPESEKTEKRNFEMVSAKPEAEYDNDNRTNESVEFKVNNTERNIYAEDVNLRLDVSDKESEDSRLLDSGFGAGLIQAQDENMPIRNEKTPEKKYTSIIESIGLDEKFQTDFVERNMPAKPLESDSEFISTAFPDDSDLLAEDTETENQTVMHVSPKYGSTSPQKDMCSSPVQYVQPEVLKSERRSYHTPRRPNVGKFIPDSPAKCKKCSKKFQQESVLKQHLQFHCMMKLYKCRYCGKQLTTKQSLIRHERIHIGDRPYQCHLCQKTFADNYGCIRHINTHFNKESRSLATSTSNSKPLVKPVFDKQTYTSTSGTERNLEKSCATSPAYSHSNTESYPSEQNEMRETGDITISKQSGIVETPQIRSNLMVTQCNDGNNSPSSSSIKASSSEEKTHLYKCFRCAALFPCEQLCIAHVQKECSTKTLEDTKTPSQSADEKLNNIFQCMLCLKMFSDQKCCQTHIIECERSQANTECAVQSLLQESLLDIDLNVNMETLPILPFPEVTSEASYLDIQENQVILLPNSSVTQDTQSTHNAIQSMHNVTQSALSVTQSTLSVTQSALDVNQSAVSVTQSALDVKQSAVSVTQSSLDVKQSALSVTQSGLNASPSTRNVTQSALNSTQSTANIVAPSTTENNVTGLPNQNTLLFIPLSQMGGQGSTGIRLQSPSQSAVTVPSSNTSFTSLQQKPLVNIGANKFVLTSHSIGLVGNTGVNAMANAKPGKTKKIKSSETDLSERTCSICSKVFTTKHILKQHTLIHMERNFGCKYCMKKFHNKYGRDRHERIHTGEKPFSCPTCKRAFSDNSTYRKHTWKCCSGK